MDVRKAPMILQLTDMNALAEGSISRATQNKADRATSESVNWFSLKIRRVVVNPNNRGTFKRWCA